MFRFDLRNLGELDTLALMGHLLALLAVVGLLLIPAVLPAILITAFMGLVYVVLTLQTRQSVHLYPACRL